MKTERLQKIAIIIFPIVLSFYFFGVFISNIVSLSPALNTFFTAGFSKFAWRAAVALIYGAYIIFVVVIFKIKLNKELLLISGLVLSTALISPFFNLKPLNTQYIDQWFRLVQVQIKIGFLEILSYYSELFFGFLFLFSLFFVLPTLFRKTKLPFIVFYVLVFIMIIACIFSYVTEFSKYLHPVASAYNDNISSFFTSKNSFGIFLYQAVLISVYMIFVGGINFQNKFKGKARILWISGWSFAAFLFFITLIFTLNKNSIATTLIFLILLPLFLLYKRSMPKKQKIFLFGSYAGVLILSMILVLAVPRINSMALNLFDSSTGRNELVRIFFRNLNGAQIFVGYGHSFRFHLYVWSSNFGTYIIFDNVHNAFFSILGEKGILYLLFYIGLFIYNFYFLFKNQKNDVVIKIAIAILISFIFGSFFESTQLYISGSSGSVLVSILIAAIPLSFVNDSKGGKNEIALSEVKV